ncbi:MAG: flagellar hook-basal body complex protein FliE [Ignavibacteria bacterium]|nr:MAG: flagellar hook-basal body complex protein FliE [Ignavibacteria bacterium]
MKVTGIKNPLINQEINKTQRKSEGFQNVLGDFIKNVNQSEAEAKQKTEDFIMGKGVPIHEVMIAGEKAKTNLELLIEIRNKAVETYKELTKMPM